MNTPTAPTPSPNTPVNAADRAFGADTTENIQRATAIAAERDRLLSLVQRTLTHSRNRDARGPHGGGEDEANYALTWQVLHLLTGDREAANHCHALFADLAQWVATSCINGYEPDAEAHHGTEPFILFLPRYAAAFASTQAGDLIRGAANYVGNWVLGQPRWFDDQHQCFVSWDLGSQHADRDPTHRFEGGDHWRFLHLALSAHHLHAGDTDRYADWALTYGRARARRILTAPQPLPAEWNLDGQPLPLFEKHCQHHVHGDPLIGIEQVLASGGVHALADCYALDPDPTFREAAATVIAPLIDHIGDPYADPAAAAIRRFRLGFNDDRFDAALCAKLATWHLDDQPEHLVLPPRAQREDHGPGVGRRGDMQRWYLENNDGTLRPSPLATPAASTLAWDLTGDLRYPLHALRLAARRTDVALRAMRSGREHADKGCSIASVMAGHGRNWGTGAVTGCLQPLLAGGDVIAGTLHGAIEPLCTGNHLRLARSTLTGTEQHNWTFKS